MIASNASASEVAGTAATAATVVILGIPQAALIAALLGALLSYYRADTDELRRVPRLVFGVLAMGFAAGWGSQILPQLVPLAAKLEPEALAGLLGLAMPFLLRVGGPLVSDYIQRKAAAKAAKDKPEGTP